MPHQEPQEPAKKKETVYDPLDLSKRKQITTLGELGSVLFTGKYPQKSEADLLSEELNKSADEARTKRDDNLGNALENLRAQEMHTVDLGLAMQEAVGKGLKNDKAVLDMEITKAEAVQKGLAIPQDPPSSNIKNMLPPKWPSDGKVLEYMLTQKSGNVSAGLMDAVANRLNELQATGQRSNEIQSEEKKFGDYLLQEMQNMLKKADEEKHLSMTPFGQAGGFLGGILDIVTGPLDLGTELFGGRMSSAQKVEMLGRVYAQTSPLVRAQMDNVLGRERMEMTHERYLERSGLGSMSNFTKNMEDANKVISTSIDIRQLLANQVPDTWGSDSTTGIDRAFAAFEGIHKLLDDLRHTETKEEAEKIGKDLIEQDARMREPIQQFLSHGGTPEQIHQIMVDSVDKVNAKFQQPLQSPMGDSTTLNFTALQKATAHDFTSKLADFETAILGGIPLDIEKNLKRRLGEKGYEELQKIRGSEDSDIKVRVIPARTRDISRRFVDVPAEELIIKDEDLAVLKSEARGKPGRNINPMKAKLRELRSKMDKENVTKLENLLIGIANPEQHSAIRKAFREVFSEKK